MHSSQRMPERITPLLPICAGPPRAASRTIRRSSPMTTVWSCSARDGNGVAGHLVGCLEGPGSVHPIRVADLESIHVHSAHRNRGVGEQLVTAFLSWAVEKGAQRAAVTAYAANDAPGASMLATALPLGLSPWTSTCRANQRPTTARNARIIHADLGYVRPEKQTVEGSLGHCDAGNSHGSLTDFSRTGPTVQDSGVHAGHLAGR